VNNRNPTPCNPIKERRFPDVWPANNDDVGPGAHSRASESASVGVALGLKLAHAFEHINNAGDQGE
jgi:hypothetical protein